MFALTPMPAANLPVRVPAGRALVPAPKPPQDKMRDAARRYRRPVARRAGGRVLDVTV
jgi:hypothetical protein